MLIAGFLRGLAESALRLLGEALKRAGIVHRQVGQDLAIQFDSAFFEPVYELVIAHSVQFGGGADAHNPERGVLPLLLFASGVGKLEPALYRFFGGPVEFGFGQEVAAGAIENLFALGAALGSPFYARHE